MWPVSRNFLQALRGSHEVVVRGTVYFDGVETKKDLAFDAGSVEVDGSSLVRRTISGVGVVAEDGDTDALGEILSVYGAELLIERGIRYPTGRRELVPIGRFRIDGVEEDLATPGRLVVRGNDLAVRILDDRFLSPRAGSRGLTISEQIERLVLQAVPGASFLDYIGGVSQETIGRGIVWEEDRLEAIASLAKSVGAVFYARPDGSFAISPVKGFESAAKWTIRSGDRGVLLGGTRERTRENVRNAVKAVGSSTSSGAPPWAIRSDDDPGSPTYINGPFGRVSAVYTSPHIRSATQARAAAEAILSKSLGLQSSLSLTSIVNPALDAGDRIDVVLPSGRTERHIVDSLSVPLTISDSMTISTRVKD